MPWLEYENETGELVSREAVAKKPKVDAARTAFNAMPNWAETSKWNPATRTMNDLTAVEVAGKMFDQVAKDYVDDPRVGEKVALVATMMTMMARWAAGSASPDGVIATIDAIAATAKADL